MTLVLRYAARSDVGLVRAGNEDSGYAGPGLLVVADGMGGHAAGELASAAAVATFASLTAGWAEPEPAGAPDSVMGEMAEGVARTTSEISRVVAEHPDYKGMGTTLTALAWSSGTVTLTHVGDSRAYLLRDGELSQLTVDHTYVQMLVDTGRITATEALTHSRRNLIMRAIDGVNDVEPDLQALEARDGDRYLLCTDGLSGVVPHDAITALLGSGDPTYAASALVDRALEGGAPDNVTVVVAEVVAVDDADVESMLGAQPVVVGAAGERRNREALADIAFPDDAEPDLASTASPAPRSEPVEIADTVGSTGAAPPSRRHARRSGRAWLWPTLAVLTVLALIAAGMTAALMWGRSQYFVGVSDGKVTIFQGLSNSVAGVHLSQPYSVSEVAVTALPTFDQERVASAIPAGGLAEAQRIVDRLASQSALCVASPSTSGCPSATTPSGVVPTGPSPLGTVVPGPLVTQPTVTLSPAPAPS